MVSSNARKRNLRDPLVVWYNFLMFLSKLFDQTHVQEFDPAMSQAERDQYVEDVLRMIDETGIKVTHRETDDGIEFGFTDPGHAETLRLNLIAMDGDFGAHTHTQNFQNASDRDAWMALATEVSIALNIKFDGFVFDDLVEMDFERSEDAIILKEAIEIAWRDGANLGIAHGRGTQQRMAMLRDDLQSYSTHGP